MFPQKDRTPHSCRPGPAGTSWTAVSPVIPAAAGWREGSYSLGSDVICRVKSPSRQCCVRDSCRESSRLPVDKPLTLATTGLSFRVTRTPRMSGQCTPGGAKQNSPHLLPPPSTHRKLEPKRDSGKDLAQDVEGGAAALGGEGAGSRRQSAAQSPKATPGLQPPPTRGPSAAVVPPPSPRTCPSLW